MEGCQRAVLLAPPGAPKPNKSHSFGRTAPKGLYTLKLSLVVVLMLSVVSQLPSLQDVDGFRVQGLGFRVWGLGIRVRIKLPVDLGKRKSCSMLRTIPEYKSNLVPCPKDPKARALKSPNRV